MMVWADHGVGMPRGKHNAWEQGTHVPLIVRFPKKYEHPRTSFWRKMWSQKPSSLSTGSDQIRSQKIP